MPAPKETVYYRATTKGLGAGKTVKHGGTLRGDLVTTFWPHHRWNVLSDFALFNYTMTKIKALATNSDVRGATSLAAKQRAVRRFDSDFAWLVRHGFLRRVH